MKTKITEQEVIEFKRVNAISSAINIMNATFINATTDEMHKFQPFILSLLLGYHVDLKQAEFEEIGQIIFIIWEYFKTSPNIRKKQISQEQYDLSQDKLISILKYVQNEKDPQSVNSIFKDDLLKLKSTILFGEVLSRFDLRKPLAEMEMQQKFILIAGMKSLIECFEDLT